MPQKDINSQHIRLNTYQSHYLAYSDIEYLKLI